MGTLSTLISTARVRARDKDEQVYTDADLLLFVNDILSDIRNLLVQIESDFVYAEDTITIEADTMEYTPSFDHEGFMKNGVWINTNSTFLKQVNEGDKTQYNYTTSTSEPTAFYITEDHDVGFLPVPDDDYTVHCLLWKPLTELDAATYITDDDLNAAGNAADLPWKGMWNSVVQRLLVGDMLDTQDRDSTVQFIMATEIGKNAMNATLRYGHRRRRQSSNMFSRGG